MSVFDIKSFSSISIHNLTVFLYLSLSVIILYDFQMPWCLMAAVNSVTFVLAYIPAWTSPALNWVLKSIAKSTWKRITFSFERSSWNSSLIILLVLTCLRYGPQASMTISLSSPTHPDLATFTTRFTSFPFLVFVSIDSQIFQTTSCSSLFCFSVIMSKRRIPSWQMLQLPLQHGAFKSELLHRTEGQKSLSTSTLKGFSKRR